MGLRTLFTAALAVAAVAVQTGCGNKCATEPPKVAVVPACSNMAANATVTVGIQLCPTCNQTGATCAVDLSGVGAGIIQLDPQVEACENTSSCPPTCQVAPLLCTFTAPAATPDPYTILVFDAGTGNTIERPFTVAASGGQTNCSIPIPL